MMEKSKVPYDTMSVNSNSTEPGHWCCFCIPLRLGCFILGYLNLFFNAIFTIFFVGLTLYSALKTHGFDYIDPPTPTDDGHAYTVTLDNYIYSLDHESIKILGCLLLFVTVCDFIWLAINIACLVGIHKKRPGLIRTYVGFTTFRLLLTMAGYIYQLSAGDSVHPINIVHYIDFVLTAYFTFVYYIYAMKLEKEARQVPQVQVNDMAYLYPTKVDKEYLVV